MLFPDQHCVQGLNKHFSHKDIMTVYWKGIVYYSLISITGYLDYGQNIENDYFCCCFYSESALLFMRAVKTFTFLKDGSVETFLEVVVQWLVLITCSTLSSFHSVVLSFPLLFPRSIEGTFKKVGGSLTALVICGCWMIKTSLHFWILLSWWSGSQ